MPTTHYSLSLNEPMSQLVVELAENSKYTALENSIRASVVFTAMTARELRKFEQKLADVEAELKTLRESNLPKQKKQFPVTEAKLLSKKDELYFSALNMIRALNLQFEAGTILKVQSSIKDF